VVPLSKHGTVLINTSATDIQISGWEQERIEAVAIGEHTEKIEATVTGEPPKQRVLLTVSRRRPAELITVKVPRFVDVELIESVRGDIEITNVDGSVRIGQGRGDIKISQVGALNVQRSGGDIVVHEVKGEVFIRSAYGDINIDGAGKSVDVAAAGGDMDVSNAGGDVRVNTATGDITIRCVKGRAEVNSASGSITLEGVNGDIDAGTASGDVSFTGAIRSGGTYRLKSLSGLLELKLPADTRGFTATLITYNGSLDLQFPLKVEGPLPGGPINRKFTGTYGDGSARVTLDSFNGEMRIAKIVGALTKCK
jgi:DUF4097 and DUF4098 domain-containing protein YvlB